jgi:hypothetical protein
MQCSKPTLEEKAVEEIQRVLKAINEDVLLFRQKVEGTQKTEKGSAMNIRLFPVYSRVAEIPCLFQSGGANCTASTVAPTVAIRLATLRTPGEDI